MSERWKRLKTGEKVLFVGVSLLILVAVTNYIAIETIRMRSDKPMYPIRTHYEFAGEGFRGSELFRLDNCTNCHKAVGNGTNMGLELDGIGSRRELSYLMAFLRDPEATYQAGHTVDHGPGKEADYVSKLPPDDQRAIAIFLSQLKSDRGAATAQAPPEGKSGFIDAMLDLWAPDSWRILFNDVRAGAGAKTGAQPGIQPGIQPSVAGKVGNAEAPTGTSTTQGTQGSGNGN